MPTASLDKHNRTHTGERPFSCEFCEQRFTEKGPLLRHVASRHQEGRPHFCQICGKTFKGARACGRPSPSLSPGHPPRSGRLGRCPLASAGRAPPGEQQWLSQTPWQRRFLPANRVLSPGVNDFD